MVGAVLLLGLLGTVRADGAVKLKTAQRNAAITTLAKFPSVKYRDIRVSGAKVTFKDWGSRLTLQVAVAHRSQVDPDYTRVDLVGKGGQIRLMGLIEKTGGKHRLHYFGPVFDAAKTLCKKPAPGVRIVVDLGLDPVRDGGYGVKNCRYDRVTSSMTTPMSAAEVQSLRTIYELQEYITEDSWGWRSPQTPAYKEASATCHWDATNATFFGPGGVVSRSDRRFGVLSITCIAGSVNGAGAYSRTQLLVSRAGTTGPFTKLIAHVVPRWSMMTGECTNDKRTWGLAARTRVDLQFCTPFPSQLYNLNQNYL